MGTAIALGCILAVVIGGALLACREKGSEGAVTDNRQPATGNCRKER